MQGSTKREFFGLVASLKWKLNVKNRGENSSVAHWHLNAPTCDGPNLRFATAFIPQSLSRKVGMSLFFFFPSFSGDFFSSSRFLPIRNASIKLAGHNLDPAIARKSQTSCFANWKWPFVTGEERERDRFDVRAGLCPFVSIGHLQNWVTRFSSCSSREISSLGVAAVSYGCRLRRDMLWSLTALACLVQYEFCRGTKTSSVWFLRKRRIYKGSWMTKGLDT